MKKEKKYGIKCLLGNHIVDKTPRIYGDAQQKCNDLTRKAHLAGLFDMNYIPVDLKFCKNEKN
jgi:hypothetical protein